MQNAIDILIIPAFHIQIYTFLKEVKQELEALASEESAVHLAWARAQELYAAGDLSSEEIVLYEFEKLRLEREIELRRRITKDWEQNYQLTQRTINMYIAREGNDKA
jgi:hypothetical protein